MCGAVQVPRCDVEHPASFLSHEPWTCLLQSHPSFCPTHVAPTTRRLPWSYVPPASPSLPPAPAAPTPSAYLPARITCAYDQPRWPSTRPDIPATRHRSAPSTFLARPAPSFFPPATLPGLCVCPWSPVPPQACGVPFEPVYIDSATGAWMAPGFNYMEKRADWQEYLDVKNNRKDYLTDEQIEQQRRWQQQQAEQKGGGSGSVAAGTGGGDGGVGAAPAAGDAASSAPGS